MLPFWLNDFDLTIDARSNQGVSGLKVFTSICSQSKDPRNKAAWALRPHSLCSQLLKLWGGCFFFNKCIPEERGIFKVENILKDYISQDAARTQYGCLSCLSLLLVSFPKKGRMFHSVVFEFFLSYFLMSNLLRTGRHKENWLKANNLYLTSASSLSCAVRLFKMSSGNGLPMWSSKIKQGIF